ncbi:ABC transporter permease [uncultured Paracoccus sp.]|uniref:ABC transporter permease n=1 Tax=uncultured Paracoccus sp. TaxID=189685 RepID=UPI002610A47E|nr:ABC transporter permease [uncultured Paracoccus sp.]
MADRKRFDVRALPGLSFMAGSCFVLLYLPILLVVIYSFNAGNTVSIWEGFSWRWYQAAWNNAAVQEATLRSLMVASIASVLATAAAVLAALATTRSRGFRGRGIVLGLINQPLMVPEIVTAVGLLIVFSMIKVATGYQGIGYVILAHASFCTPFAFMSIRARLQGMDLSLENAGADLYGTPVRIFRHVTLPQLWPGILSGWMLAFVISLDNVVITEFVKSAGQDTLPTYMLGQLRRKITPEINAISTVLLLISIALVITAYLAGRKRA